MSVLAGLIGITLLFLLGFLAGLIVASIIARRRNLQRILASGDIIATVYDVVKKERYDLPVKKVAGNLYIYADGNTIKYVVIPPRATVFTSRVLAPGKPSVIALGIDPLYVARDGESLARLGIASITIPELNVTGTPNPEAGIDALVDKLVKMPPIYAGEIPVTDNMTLGIALNVPELTKGILADQLIDSVIATTSMKALTEGFKEWTEAIKRVAQAKSTILQSVGRLIMIIGIVGAILAAMALLLPRIISMFVG